MLVKDGKVDQGVGGEGGVLKTGYFIIFKTDVLFQLILLNIII